jgi:hypothetical protein
MREKPLQLVPNSYERTRPDTTPIPKETANILVQNAARSRKRSSLVIIHRASRTEMNAHSPTVKAGKMMWKVIVKPN